MQTQRGRRFVPPRPSQASLLYDGNVCTYCDSMCTTIYGSSKYTATPEELDPDGSRGGFITTGTMAYVITEDIDLTETQIANIKRFLSYGEPALQA